MTWGYHFIYRLFYNWQFSIQGGWSWIYEEQTLVYHIEFVSDLEKRTCKKDNKEACCQCPAQEIKPLLSQSTDCMQGFQSVCIVYQQTLIGLYLLATGGSLLQNTWGQIGKREGVWTAVSTWMTVSFIILISWRWRQM